jgi:hypothetical protein
MSGDGKEVYVGDRIEFDTEGSIFPSSGIVSTYKGLRVECFDTLLNKWKYYELSK